MQESDKLENATESLQNQENAVLEENLQQSESNEDEAIDYASIVKADIEELSAEFSELKDLRDITELENPMRYAALRDLGLSAAEAYLATTKNRRKTDNRSHLFGMPMVAASGSASMPDRELEAAREIFTDISDAQIRKLYKKVTR